MTFTPAAASDIWVILVSARLRSSSPAAIAAEARYLVNRVEHGIGGVQNQPSNVGATWQHFYRVTGTTATQLVQVQLRDAQGSTSTLEDLRLIVVPTASKRRFPIRRDRGRANGDDERLVRLRELDVHSVERRRLLGLRARHD